MYRKLPAISVVMSVYNGEKYIYDAISSIQSQSFEDFEFIIIDDGSVDKSADIIKSFNDPRIRLFHQTNQGLSVALNNGIAQARSEYIARMDADDISGESRLGIEYNFLQSNPLVGVVGTWIVIIDESGTEIGRKEEPVSVSEIARLMMTSNCINHGTAMFRKSIFEKAGGYSVNYPESVPVEDYALWLRMLNQCDVANIPEYLYFWRQHFESISNLQKKKQQEQFFLVSQNHVQNVIAGFEQHNIKNKELAYSYFCLGIVFYHQGEMKKCRKYLLKALSIDPTIDRKAYRHLGLSFFNPEFRVGMRKLYDSLTC